MQEDPPPRRRRTRLPHYDYGWPGVYFITICAHQRQLLFGAIADGTMQLSSFGEIVQHELLQTPMVRRDVKVDPFVVMPNHIHALIQIDATPQNSLSRSGTRRHGLTASSIGAIVGQLKSIATKRINAVRGFVGPVWQRNYHEHVVRDEREWERITHYILNNPDQWPEDWENPTGTGMARYRPPWEEPTGGPQ